MAQWLYSSNQYLLAFLFKEGFGGVVAEATTFMSNAPF